MGFVTLNDGTVIHTSQLSPNPIVGIETTETKITGMVTYVTQNYVYKDGTKQTVTLSYTTS